MGLGGKAEGNRLILGGKIGLGGSVPVGGGGGDADAQAFLTATGIVDATITAAINQLVDDLKAENIWTKMAALYPFVGGTADTHKYNLKDPRDLDAAFRITWAGTITHNANGITPDGLTGYGNTHLDGSNLLDRDVHLSFYSKTDVATNGHDISASGTTNLFLRARVATGNFNFRCTGLGTQAIVANANSFGHYVGSRTSATSSTGYKNGVSLVTNVTNESEDTTILSQSFFIGAQGASGSPVAGTFTSRNYALASIGAGLTPQDADVYYTAVQSFQTALGRQV